MSNELGILTRKQFNDEITSFIEKSDILNENWCIRQHKNDDDCKYLVKRITIPFFGPCQPNIVERANIDNYVDELDDFDYNVCDLPDSQETATFEYHVVYSPSYSVPVLYFSAWMQDGKLFTLDQIWNQVSQIHQHFVYHDKWSFITQQEHPLLQRPFFLVHPCHTADFMKVLKTNTTPSVSKQCPYGYIMTWLSAVGPTVGLELPMRLAVDE